MSYEYKIKPCALLFGDAGTVLVGMPSLGLRTKIEARMGTANPPCANPYFGFTLTFPRDPGQVASEKEGKGVCFAYDPITDKPVLSDFTVTFKFPRGEISCTHLPVPANIQDKFPKVQDWQGFTYLVVKLNDSSNPTIEGYRKEYFNSPDPKLQAWVNYHGRIDGVSFLEVLHQRAFSFVVELPIDSCKEIMGDQNLPGPFTYGYAYQPNNVQQMKTLVDENKGRAFPACYSFDGDDAHVTAINQSVIQDTLWVHREAEMIAEERLLAYFVSPNGPVPPGTAVHLVVPVSKAWSDSHSHAWPRLMASPLVKIKFYDVITPGHTEPALWTGRIMERDNLAPELRAHLSEDQDLIVRVLTASVPRIDVPHYPDQRTAITALKKRNVLDPRTLSADQVKLYFRVLTQTMAHRAVLRGTGFYEVLSQKWTGLSIGALPSMCYRLYDDRYLMQCITEEAGYHDLQRFRDYLLGRELNIGIIIGLPGSGTTSLGAAAALAMQVQLGQILCSGPTHEAINVFAERLDQRARAVAARYNTVMPTGDVKRCHHRMVIRMYKPGDELNAVIQLVKNSEDLDWTTRRGEFVEQSHWKLHLSLTYWFLVVMRSSAVPPLSEDSKPGLVKLQADIDTSPYLLHLCQWVTGQMNSAQYAATHRVLPNIKLVLYKIMCQADFLCVHPADTEISPIPQWKSTIARGLVVDEAGSMSRADFYGLWGNSLLPCFLFGDPDKKPVVLTTDEADGNGNLYNRFAADGAISPLKYLMATGIPRVPLGRFCAALTRCSSAKVLGSWVEYLRHRGRQ
ncbi:hypothetical protein FDENT_7040 [Fusarium denticulatum]|uniref:Uncharacterized protein n=1 Tax=Fusarium denticulatum TaxID=48507 RepID=A0A8H5U712_9HYPO|nr:hypothetical protein FDENT_7040 [Fusarium denticulatum]